MQTEFDVFMKSFGSEKLKVVKVVKDLTGKSLVDAKNLVESVPAIITEKINKEQAESIKNQLELVGAEVEIK